MSTGQVDILLPCDVLTVDVQLGSKAQASPIQRIVLEAIEHKCGTIQEISSLLAIPHRPIMALLLEFWRGGYILLDLEHHHLQLSPEGSSVLHGTHDGIARDAEVVVSVDLLQEMVSGNLIPYTRPPRASTELLSAPRLIDTHQYSQISSASMREVLNRSASVRTLRRNYKILGFAFNRPAGLQALRSENLTSSLRVSVTPGGAVDIEALIQSGINASMARQIGESLGKFVSSSPEHTFSQMLSKAATRRDRSGPRTFESGLKEMEICLTRVGDQGLNNIDPDTIEALILAGAKTTDELEKLALSQADQAILGVEAFWTRLECLLGRPFRQLLINLTEYDVAPFQRLASIIKRQFDQIAIDEEPLRGIRAFDRKVYVLWGKSRGDLLAFQNKQILIEFEKISRGIHVASQSCAIDVGFIIVDNREGLFFDSRYFLDHPPSSAVAISLMPRSNTYMMAEKAASRISGALSGLLGWLRHVHPDYDIGRLIRTSFHDLDNVTDKAVIPSDFLSHRAFCGFTEAKRQAIFHNWLVAWSDLTNSVKARRERMIGISVVLQDAQLNDAILEMIGHQSPLFLAFGAVDRRTFSSTILRRLEERCQARRATSIAVAFARGVKPGDALTPVFEIADRYPDLLTVRDVPHWRGLCVAHADAALLAPGASWRTQLTTNLASHSLAVLVQDRAFARDVVAEVANRSLGIGFPLAAAVDYGVPVEEVARQVSPHLFEWAVNYQLNETPEERHELVLDLCEGTGNLSADLEYLGQQLSGADFSRLLSTMIAEGLIPEVEMPRWTALVGLNYWINGRFAECYMLGRAAGPSAAKPPLWLSELALGLFADDSVLPNIADMRDELEAPVCACIIGLCFHGTGRLRLPLEELIGVVPAGPAKRVAELFRDYWDDCPQGLPVYRESAAHWGGTKLLSEVAWRGYLSVVDEANGIMLKSKPCTMVMSKLFDDAGAIGNLTKTLKHCAERERSKIAAAWIRRHGNDAGRFLKSAESTVLIRGKRVRVVGERRNYLARYFARLIASIGDLSNSITARDDQSLAIVERAEQLRRGLVRIRPEAEEWIAQGNASSLAVPTLRELLRFCDSGDKSHGETR